MLSHIKTTQSQSNELKKYLVDGQSGQWFWVGKDTKPMRLWTISLKLLQNLKNWFFV